MLAIFAPLPLFYMELNAAYGNPRVLLKPPFVLISKMCSLASLAIPCFVVTTRGLASNDAGDTRTMATRNILIISVSSIVFDNLVLAHVPVVNSVRIGRSEESVIGLSSGVDDRDHLALTSKTSLRKWPTF